MESIEIRLPDEQIVQEWSQEAEEVLKPDIVTNGSGEIDLEMSVDLYVLGGNRRVSTDRASRLRAHLDNPFLMAGFKDVSRERYDDMMNQQRRESTRSLHRLHDRLENSLGDYQIYLEEVYDLISDGQINAEFFWTPVELEGIDDVLDAAEVAERMMARSPDYEVKEARLLGGIEQETIDDAMEEITPAVSLEITYSGDPDALEKYMEFAEQYAGLPDDVEGVPGTVYLGRENYPQVVFNGPPYETLQNEEVEKEIWRKIEE